jgi:hypothetical protein
VNPRAEAWERLRGRYEVRVLEPSPPALPDNADDPTARGEVPKGRELVSPVSSGDLLWSDLCRDDAELAAWCRERWLGAWKRLEPAPASLGATRSALHLVAEKVVSPARVAGTGNEISLRYTRGGFGTPFYGDDEQVRVEGAELVVEKDGQEHREILPTIDRDAARFLGDWFGFGTLVIAEIRARAGEGMDASSLNLWPEHFDVAAELGSEERGQRAGYGASPGDEEHTEPYIYVTPWQPPPGGELWNATAFSGAEMTYAELLDAENQVEAAVGFFEARLRELTASR